MTKHPGLVEGRGRNTLPRERKVKKERLFLFINIHNINLDRYKIRAARRTVGSS